MFTKKLSCVLPVLIVGAIAGLFLDGIAQGAIMITLTKDVAPGGGSGAYNPTTFSASGSDLAEGLIPAVSWVNMDLSPGAGNTMEFGMAGETAWTDGSLSTFYGAGDFSAYGALDARVGQDPDTMYVTYDLGGLFNLSQIDAYLGWVDSGRDEASFNVYVAGTSGVFGSAIASHVKGPDDTGTFVDPVTNRIRIADDGAADIASNVQFVQFEFVDSDNGIAGGVEFDIFGTVVPEPTSIALMSLGILGMLGRVRRQVAAS